MHCFILYNQTTAIHILALNFKFFDQSIHLLNDSDGTLEVHSIKSLYKHVSKEKKNTASANVGNIHINT